MSNQWDGGTPVPPPYKGRHHKQRGRREYRPVHKKRRGCKSQATAALMLAVMAVAGGLATGVYLLVPLLIAWQSGP